MGSRVIRVLVVDDHSLVRAGVSRVLSEAHGIEVVGECDDGVHVAGVAASVLPDVVLMDMRMPVTSGPEATRGLLAVQPGIRVVMLSASMSGRALDEAEQAGALGYVLKGGDPDLLVNAVHTVAAGGTAWPSGVSF
jgi:two-component system invasion response regulator UvrY